jgi:hypothetical protein
VAEVQASKERRKMNMAEEQNKTQEEFQSCCQGMPFADMMRKMTEAKKSGSPFNCAEMMQKCCDYGKKEEEPKENPFPNA